MKMKLRTIDGVMSLALFLQVVSQALQHFRSSETQATCDGYISSALRFNLAGNPGGLTWVRLQQRQDQRYPFPTVRAVFSSVQTMAWLPVLWTFNVHTEAVGIQEESEH